MFLRLLVKLLLETGDSRQILLLLQEHTVALQVGILDPLLAFISQLLDCLLLLLVESDPLLLVLQKGHKVVVLFSPSLQFRGNSSEVVFLLAKFSFEVDDLRFDISHFDPIDVQLLGQQVDFVLLLGSKLIMGSLDKVKLLGDDF